MKNELTINKPSGTRSKFSRKESTINATHTCHRCGGLMVHDDCLDVASDTGEVRIAVLRCFACGELIDRTILRNRREPLSPNSTGMRKRRVYAAIPQGLTHQN